MDDLSIYTLVMLLRGFSNQITARGLAERLGVSYPTLARCKSGVWPRSITLDAVRGAFEDCRERFFDGDGEAMARSVLMQLEGQGVGTGGLARILEVGGYDAFMAALITAARRREPVVAPEVVPDVAGAPPVAPVGPNVPLAAEAAPVSDDASGRNAPGTGVVGRHLAMVAPVAILLALGMSGASVSTLVAWAGANRLAFFCASAAVAVAPALVGALVDSPLAWHRWALAHPGARPSMRDLALIAKFGGTVQLVPFGGRFNLTPSYLAFQPVCNLLGMMCYVSLLGLLLALPGFLEFFAANDWVESFKVGVVVAYYIAYQSMREQYSRPFVGVFGLGVCENPDNYLPSRPHIWANAVHLVWTVSLLIVLLLGLVAYSLANFRRMEAPALMLWPYLQSMLFFVFSSASPYAVRTRATGAGVLLPGVAATSAGFAVLALVCYLPSPGALALCVACVACTGAALAWVRHVRGGEGTAWLGQTRASAAYAAAVVLTLVVLLVVCMARLSLA